MIANNALCQGDTGRVAQTGPPGKLAWRDLIF